MKLPTLNLNMKLVIPSMLLLAVGMFMGWLLFANSGSDDGAMANGHDHDEQAASTIWTCSMHPQIRQEEPGLCPICAMELIPLENDAAADMPGKLQMSEEAVQSANVRTVAVERGMPFREIRLPGKVQADESRQAEITARIAGRIEKLYVNVTGQQVRRGQKLVEVYSPELIAAQKELLEALKMRESSPSYLSAARSKLRFWDLSDEQIQQIEEGGVVRRTFDILSPQSGTVLMRHVSDGDYVREGQPLLEISDLSRVWVLFDAYENDLAWIRNGMELRFSVAGMPGKEYSGKVNFIDPVIDPMSRVAHVRVEMPNAGGTLKPEMFATGVVKSMLAGESEHLVIPKTAVLWTGKRSVVWVRDMDSEAPVFEYREVRLGSEAGDSYVIEEGLMEGEHVVANGVFSIDAAAQLQGKASMMNPSGGPAPSGHDHGGNTGRTTAAPASSPVPSAFRVQLQALFKSYEKISSALIASDPTMVPAAVSSMRKVLDAIDGSLLSVEMKLHWVEMRSMLRKSLDALRGTRDIKKQRAYYSGISNTLYDALKHYGIDSGTIYRQYCPMAFDNKGAFWLSSTKEIRNPFFGEKMLKCGSTKEELK